jgi:medium-chain acyl-[acyl-carrier-protein] hydrolase
VTEGTMAWLPYGIRRPHAKARLFCLPYAGGVASAYRSWPGQVPPCLEVAPVQLPGRETRLRERPIDRVPDLVEALVEGLRPFLDRPFAVFGHSFGALVGFVLCQQLHHRGLPGPERLFVSAHRAPHLPARRPPIHHLADDDMMAELRRLGGTPAAALECEELMRVVLPAVRADFTAAESYRYRADEPLRCPIVGFAGASDSEVSPSELDGWGQHTFQPFALRVLAGGHFFPFEAPWPVLASMVENLEGTTALAG